MKFNVFKYKEWLKKVQKIDRVNIDILLDQNGMEKFHGIDYEQLWKEGHIILKIWCDCEHKFDENGYCNECGTIERK